MISTAQATPAPYTAVEEPAMESPDHTAVPALTTARLTAPAAVRESHRLPGVLASVSSARRLVEHFLHRLARTDLADAATLVVSELVTNAVEHGRPPVHLDLACSTGIRPVLRLDVHDHGRVVLHSVDRHADGEAESGRGLLIIDHLAARWGLGPHPVHGTLAWAEIATAAE